MIPITPIGTRTRANFNPFGRVHSASVAPTGSGNSAMSSKPRATASMRASVSVSRSMKDAASPPAFAASKSAAFAFRMAALCCRRCAAIEHKAAFFVAVDASASSRDAARAARPMTNIASRRSSAFCSGRPADITSSKPPYRSDARVRPRRCSRGSLRCRRCVCPRSVLHRHLRKPQDRAPAPARPETG